MLEIYRSQGGEAEKGGCSRDAGRAQLASCHNFPAVAVAKSPPHAALELAGFLFILQASAQARKHPHSIYEALHAGCLLVDPHRRTHLGGAERNQSSEGPLRTSASCSFG